MTTYFIDTSYVIALVNPKDEYHSWALRLSEKVNDCRFITTDLILFEVANYLAKDFKPQFIEIINSFIKSEDIKIIWHSGNLFKKAYEKYCRFYDKQWGLVDCLSFVIMEKNNITTALSIDHHFEQAGFLLLKNQ